MTDLNKRFRNCTLDNYNCETDEQKELIKYIKSCVTGEFKENIVLIGGVGLGKTHIAYGIINALEEIKRRANDEYEWYTNKKVNLTSIKTIIDNIRACWKPNADKYDHEAIINLKTIPLLIIDEVGVQYGTESERLELFDIFNCRYNDMLPTMVISNCNKEQMSKILGQRITDRLFGSAKIFELEGVSKR